MHTAIEVLEFAAGSWALATAAYAAYMLSRFVMNRRSEAELDSAKRW